MANYTVVLFQDAEGGYTAVVPALPGCITEGVTLEETLTLVREAITLYLESALAHNEEILEERHPPVIATVEVEYPAKAALR